MAKLVSAATRWSISASECSGDERRECFLSLCHDLAVQKLTFEAYMNKELLKARPMAQLKIGFRNLSHLTGRVSLLRVLPT